MAAKGVNRMLVLGAGIMMLSCRAMVRADDGGADSGGMAGATRLYVDPAEDSQLLGKRYQKKSEGFSLAPPAGSRMIERDGIDLVSYVVDDKDWGGSLELVRPPKDALPLSGFVDIVVSGLQNDHKSFKAVQLVDRKEIKQNGKAAVRLSLKMQAELGASVPGTGQRVPNKSGSKDPAALTAGRTVDLLCQEVIVAPKQDGKGMTDQFLVFTLFSPLKDKDVATRTFDAMLENFELFDPATLQAELQASVKLGKEWLAKRSAEEFASKLDAEPRFFRILVNNKDMGFIRFDEANKERDKQGALMNANRVGRDGVLFSATVLSFPSDGSVIMAKNTAFWGYTKDASGGVLGHFSMWDNISKTSAKVPLSPKMIKPGGPTFEIVTPWLDETGTISQDAPIPVRLHPPYSMNITFGGDKTQHLANDLSQVIPEEADAPLPAVLQYTWPRFVDVTQPSKMTFVVYNSGAKKLDLRTLIVTGKKQDVTVDGKVMSCYKCVDEMDPNSTTLWVDRDGKIQMMVTSDQSVMPRTTGDAMNAKWKTQMDRLKDQ